MKSAKLSLLLLAGLMVAAVNAADSSNNTMCTELRTDFAHISTCEAGKPLLPANSERAMQCYQGGHLNGRDYPVTPSSCSDSQMDKCLKIMVGGGKALYACGYNDKHKDGCFLPGDGNCWCFCSANLCNSEGWNPSCNGGDGSKGSSNMGLWLVVALLTFGKLYSQ